METTRRHAAPARDRARGARAPNWPTGACRQLRLTARGLGVLLLALVLTVGAVFLSLHPPAGHLGQLVVYLAISGFVALVVAALARWLATLPHWSSVRLQLAVPPALTALLIAVTTLLLAHGMFL